MSNFDEKEKKIIVEQYLEGKNTKEILLKYKISRSTLYNWINQFSELQKNRNTKNETVTHLQYSKLEKNKEYTSQENEICKLFIEQLDINDKEKYKFIHEHKDNYSIHALCGALNVLRGTYYHYARKTEMTKTEKDDELYKKHIYEIFNESNQVFGAKKIRVKLKELGFIVSERRIQRLMNELELKCNRKKLPRKHRPEKERQYYKNKLDRKFEQEEPNKVWVCDITYFRVNDTMCYICVVIDLFSRKVLSYEVSTTMSSTLVSTTFLEAYIRRGSPKGLMYHSDQGAQYTSNAFRKRLHEYGVEQSLSKKGCPYDNAVIESFFGTLKKESLNRGDFEYVGDLIRTVKDYIDFYNDYRPHRSLEYKTPNQVEELYYRQK